MSQKLLENYIREALTISESEKDIKTFGDLKKLLKRMSVAKDLKGKGKAAAEFGLDMALDAIPGAGTAMSVFNLVKGFAKAPDGKRPKNFLGNFDLDDDVSKIVDNDIEDEFIKDLVKKIENKNDNEELGDFNMTEMLNDYLAGQYKGNRVNK